MPIFGNLKFPPLEVSGENYLTWTINCELKLKSKGLYTTLEMRNSTTEEQKNKAMVIIRTHLTEDLQNQYLTVLDPGNLWRELKARYNHQAEIILPTARYEWHNLRLQDHKSVNEYNSAMYKIVTKLRMCGEEITDKDMMEKTFTTFHANQTVLQQQYRLRNFSNYNDLITCLLVAEQNDQLLLKNHEMRPSGSRAFPEANAYSTENYGRGRGHGRGRDRDHGRGYGRGRGRGHERGRGRGRENNYERNYGHPYHMNNRSNDIPQKWNVYDARKDKGKAVQEQQKFNRGPCYRCGSPTYYSRTCRAPKHVVEAYQALKREQEKNKSAETNLVDKMDPFDDGNDGPIDISHLDTSDFFEDPNGRIDYLIGDGNVQNH